MAKRATPEQYDRALQLRRASVGRKMICEIVGIKIEILDVLLTQGLRAWKGHHAARPSILSVLVAEHAATAGDAKAWATSMVSAARKIAEVRGETSLGSAQIERVLIRAWQQKIGKATKDAHGKAVDLDGLLPKPVFLQALRTLAKTRDLAPDVRAPIGLYGPILAESQQGEGDEETSEAFLDPSIYGDLIAMAPVELEWFAKHGEKPTAAQLKLVGIEGE